MVVFEVIYVLISIVISPVILLLHCWKMSRDMDESGLG